MRAPLLQIRGLETRVFAEEGDFRAVDGVSLEVRRGEAVGVVGESGCGKTMLAHSILRLLPAEARIERGEVLFEGLDLLRLDDGRLREIRGRKIAMVFQEPLTALNPVLTLETQIGEVLALQRGIGRDACRQGAIEALREVGIGAPESRLSNFPHQLSGGMRQRAMIAMALAGQPSLLVADEPTTALDATVQAQILALLVRLREQRNLAILLISHDLVPLAEFCERIYVLLDGQVVESGPAQAILERPLHPYSRELVGFRSLDASREEPEVRSRQSASTLLAEESQQACRFVDRCPRSQSLCAEQAPVLEQATTGREVRCFFPIRQVDGLEAG